MPMCLAKALWAQTESTETPSTTALAPLNRGRSFTKQACSFVQTGEKSSG